MGIFSNIVNAIFGSKAAAAVPGASAAIESTAAAPAAASASSAAGSAAAASTAQAKPTPISKADVEAIIAKIEAERGVKYNWRQSIVDLMKLLDLDSSLAARKELAQELGYKGALDGSAEMNVWLHKQVMEKLAEGGGKVPESLKG
jgi:3-oxoacyl-ACP reductase-like protein